MKVVLVVRELPQSAAIWAHYPATCRGSSEDLLASGVEHNHAGNFSFFE